MKIAYGTYGMPGVAPREALSRLAAMGYEGVELCIGSRWPTAPAAFSAPDRGRLRGLFRELGLELPALMTFLNLLAPAGGELAGQEAQLREGCALARDLAPDERIPVIASVIGHSDQEWDAVFPTLVDRAARFGAIAASEGCRLALEPHVGPLLNSPDRTLALMERVHSPSLGINFDISHFEAGGYPRAETIAALVPYAFHTHVKDARVVEGRVRFLLPGEGDFDYATYFREMAAAGWTGCITVEVSVQIYDQPGYDPWAAAESSLQVLRGARAKALKT
jgi:sugar phosphate isomerase/epimerase